MIPILYAPTEKTFDHNGIGHLTDCTGCEVTEELNGAFELQLQYPVQGRYFSQIKQRSIIKARADLLRVPQLFRVYKLSKPMQGVVTVSARHISYDLLGMPVSPFTAESAAETMAGLKINNAALECTFTFETDVSNLGTFRNKVPASARACLGGIEGSILQIYGGELEFDNFTVRLCKARGSDNGVSIRYGKNLISLQQEENCAAVYAGVYPYWSRTETKDDQTVTSYVELDEKVIMRTGDYDFFTVMPLDLSDEFDETPTQEQLRDAAKAYIEAHSIFTPEVSLTVSFALLWQTEEYKHIRDLEYVSLGDTVSVYFPAMDISSKAKVVKTVFDSLRSRYKSVTLGTVKQTVADLLASQNTAIKSMEGAGLHGSVNATDINLFGSFIVRSGDTVGGRLGYMSGLTGGGEVTNGIGMRNADGTCFAVVTDAGVSMRSANAGIYAAGGTVGISGDAVTVAGKTVTWRDNGDGTYTMIGT